MIPLFHVFRPGFCIHFLSLLCVLYAPPILSSSVTLIMFSEEYKLLGSLLCYFSNSCHCLLLLLLSWISSICNSRNLPPGPGLLGFWLRLHRGFIRLLQTNAEKIIELVQNIYSSVTTTKTKLQNQIIKHVDLATIRTNTKGNYFPSKAKNSSISRWLQK